MTGTIVEIEIPVDEFVLHRTLSTVDGVRCEVERVVAHDSEQMMPLVWIHSEVTDYRAIEAAFTDDPTIAGAERLSNLSNEWLYQMEWVDQNVSVVEFLVEKKGVILAMTGDGEGWNIRVLFPDRENVSPAYEYCDENGITLSISNIQQLKNGRRNRFSLTNEQREALSLAYHHGYYDIPRELTADDLADELGISHQAVSERLRRGHGNLVENTLETGHGIDNASEKRRK